ncbi:MAG: hypothetical protein LBE12_19155 [Planctomycetaceae bacterium]|nr:hypothetical protein [Planctomycetaceae bacterium]
MNENLRKSAQSADENRQLLAVWNLFWLPAENWGKVAYRQRNISAKGFHLRFSPTVFTYGFHLRLLPTVFTYGFHLWLLPTVAYLEFTEMNTPTSEH